MTLARISSEALTPDSCLAAVTDPRAGGVGSFVGVVRNGDHGRAVQALCYEAHPSAAARLEALCCEIAARDVVAVAAEHRIGRLEIGDLAVVVAVSAVHRREALDATSDLIDAIKAHVPIWKEQHFTDGSSAWSNCG